MLNNVAFFAFTCVFVLAVGLPVPDEVCNCRAICWTDEDSGLKTCACKHEDCGGGSYCDPVFLIVGNFGPKYKCVCELSGEPEEDCLCVSGYEYGAQTHRFYPLCLQVADCTDQCCTLKDSEFPPAGGGNKNACDCRAVCAQPPE
jgi:hypothetical protein